MKLLVPVDGSTASINAVKKSIEIANMHDFSIKLIKVINPSDYAGSSLSEKLWSQTESPISSDKGIAADGSKEIASISRKNAIKLLDSITNQLNFSNIKVEKEVLFGEPYVKILEIAKNENFDLIVIGNRGFSKIKRFFLGSVSGRVISEAPCPVLVIHTDADF